MKVEYREWIIYFFLGPFAIVLSVIMNVFPPTRINHIYGYRTTQSKKNQNTWDEAQRYFGELSLPVYISLSVIEFLLFIFLEQPIAGLTSIGLLILASIYLIMRTENHLKKRFHQ